MNFIVDEFRNILALIAIEFLLIIPCMEKRKHYLIKLICGVIFCLAFVSLYVLIHKYILATNSMVLITFVSIFWYVIVVLLTGGLMVLCHKINLTDLVWTLITAYAAQHLIYIIAIEIIFFGIVGNGSNVWVQLGPYVIFAAVIYLLIYFLFIPNMRNRKHLYIQHSTRNSLVLLIFLIVFLSSTFINQANARQDYVGLNYLSAISDFVNCVLVIVVQYVGLRSAKIRFEREAAKSLLENEKKQYETFRSAVEYINIKCHDLKHEIAAMQVDGKINPKRLEEITENIAVYESFANTGNKTLDAVITDKKLICLNNGISFSCLADASGFSTIQDEDIYCLLGNMLDNAIEYVKTVNEEEKKFIRLFIRTKGNLKIIHQENYCSESLEFNDGLPQTTKGDTINHGFGSKSMRRIVQKYGGEMKVAVIDNTFKIDIVISE